MPDTSKRVRVTAEHTLMSSEYVDSPEHGEQPEEDYEDWRSELELLLAAEQEQAELEAASWLGENPVKISND